MPRVEDVKKYMQKYMETQDNLSKQRIELLRQLRLLFPTTVKMDIETNPDSHLPTNDETSTTITFYVREIEPDDIRVLQKFDMDYIIQLSPDNEYIELKLSL